MSERTLSPYDQGSLARVLEIQGKSRAAASVFEEAPAWGTKEELVVDTTGITPAADVAPEELETQVWSEGEMTLPVRHDDFSDSDEDPTEDVSPYIQEADQRHRMLRPPAVYSDNRFAADYAEPQVSGTQPYDGSETKTLRPKGERTPFQKKLIRRTAGTAATALAIGTFYWGGTTVAYHAGYAQTRTGLSSITESMEAQSVDEALWEAAEQRPEIEKKAVGLYNNLNNLRRWVK